MNYEPLLLRPCCKEAIWGGKRLKAEYGKSDAPDVTAESWELAVREDGMSRIGDGPLAGKTLLDLGMADKNGYWGVNCRQDSFPILVKLIDAAKDLSIQVHPSEETALAELGEQGKAELWYVVDSAPKASIYYGFSQRVTPEEVLRRARDGSIFQVLNRVRVKKGDVFYIKPGTVHAIGAGILIAEIQQNSNTTFRLYDYDRLDTDGKPRPLHLERAAMVMNCEPVIPAECRANNTAFFPELTASELFSCPGFRSYRLTVRGTANLRCDGASFQHLLCVEGRGEIVHNGKSRPLLRGVSCFLPAAMGEYTLRGSCCLLMSRV